ncbi:MAG TPA: hypothetical protein VHR17_06390, partial [Thermoanaerobaculia bacterium]|nr:hypothetical protein [Thermoanaerobaculia bacterium]
LFLGVFPLSGLIWGALADRLGEATVLAAGGVLVVAGALIFGRAVLRDVPVAVAAVSAAPRARSAPHDEKDAAPTAAPALEVRDPGPAAVGRN